MKAGIARCGLFFFILFAPPLIAADRGKTIVLDLAQAERLAVENGTAVRLRRNSSEIAELNRRIVRSAFLPAVGLYAVTSNQSPPPGIRRQILPGVNLDLTSAGSMQGYGIRLHYLLSTGGRTKTLYDMALAGRRAGNLLLQDAMANSRFEARRLYFQALLLDELEKLARENSERNRARLREWEEKYSAGTVSRLELLRLRSAAAEADLAVSESSDRREAALDLLRLALDLPPDSAIVLEQRLPAQSDLAVDPARLRNQSPASLRVRAAEIAAGQARLKVKAERAAHYPVVTVDARAGRVRPYLGENRTADAFHIGVQATLPLFEGGRVVSRVKKAELEADNARLRAREAARRIESRLRLILNHVESLQKNLSARQLNIERALAVREAVETAEKSGAATARELADADLAVLRHRLEYARSLVTLLTELADWERTSGHGCGVFERLKPRGTTLPPRRN